MFSTYLIIQLMALGLTTGFLAGLLGIGGGMLLVPFLTYILGTKQVGPDLAVKMAIATSMATIVFTSISSVRAHHKRAAVRWDIVAKLAPGIVLGGFVASLGVFALLKTSSAAVAHSTSPPKPWANSSNDSFRSVRMTTCMSASFRRQ